MSVQSPFAQREPIVITGIGMLAAVGNDRESVWSAVREGRSGIRSLTGLLGIPDHLLIGAPVEIAVDRPRRMRVVAMSRQAAAEALDDAQIDFANVDLDRFGCAISGHMGDTGFIEQQYNHYDESAPRSVPWWSQWMPNTACSIVANEHGLAGPRICHSTACASGLIDILAAVRAIRDNQCDVALAGSAEAFHPLFAAGFHRMNVLAYNEDPTQACRPFDRGVFRGQGGYVRDRTPEPCAATRRANLCRNCRWTDAGRGPPRNRFG